MTSKTKKNDVKLIKILMKTKTKAKIYKEKQNLN